MTDTNMTDTNIPHSGGGVPQDCGKRMRVTWHEENIVNRKAWALCGFVCAAVGGVWFRVCCAVSGATPGVVLGVLVVIVAGSRPVVLFEPGC